MSDLEPLQNVAGLGFLANDLHDGINQLRSFRVVALGPIVSRSALSEHEIIGTKQSTVRTSANGVHGSGFKIGENSTRDVTSFHALVKINVNAFQLQGIISFVRPVDRNAVLRRHDLSNTHTATKNCENKSRRAFRTETESKGGKKSLYGRSIPNANTPGKRL